MKKIYKILYTLSIIAVCQVKAQYLIPFTGSNTIPAGVWTLCSHAGCGVTYAPNAEGYTVIYPGTCGATTITGTYNTESCCDYARIYDGVGIGGTQLAHYAGSGSFTFVANPGQTLSIRFRSDGSIQNSGIQATVATSPDLSVNGHSYDYTICTGSTVNLNATGMHTYTWSPFIFSNAISVTPMSSTVYSITGRDTIVDCEVTKTVNVHVNISPTVSISGNSVICGPGNSTQLTVNGQADNYLWSNGQTGNVISVSPLQLTTYSVTATNTLGGCTDKGIFHVAFSNLPMVSISANATDVCAGHSVNLLASGALTYTWTVVNSNNAFIAHSPPASLVYQVIGANEYGCISTASVPVTVNPNPVIITQSSKTDICPGEQVILNASGAHTYQWLSSSLFLPSPIAEVHPLSTTIYTATGYSAKGCAGSATLSVEVQNCTALTELSTLPVKIFPNPTANMLNIHGAENIMRMTMMDLSGRVLIEEQPEKAEVNYNITDLPTGIYVVKLHYEHHSEIIKVVKQ